MPRPNHGLSRYCTTSEYGPLPFWGTQSSKGKERRALGRVRSQALGERGGAVARRKGWQGAVAMAMAREGRPVRARKVEAAWRFKKKETLHTSLMREVTVIIPVYLPYPLKLFFRVFGLVLCHQLPGNPPTRSLRDGLSRDLRSCKSTYGKQQHEIPIGEICICKP